jgi:hypothetical protein
VLGDELALRRCLPQLEEDDLVRLSSNLRAARLLTTHAGIPLARTFPVRVNGEDWHWRLETSPRD